MNRITTLLIAACTISAASAEDVTTAFIKCATTKDDRPRLACYDKLRDDVVKANSTPAPVANGYQSINLSDLKVDIKKLSGKKLAFTALIQTIGDTSMLKSDEMDMNPIFADSEKLPRDDRKKLANGCQMLLCKGQFYGVVKHLPLGIGVSVERVEWR